MDHPVLEDIAVFGQQQRHAHVLFDQQQGHAVAANAVDDAEDIENHLRGERRTRLVEQDHLGFRHQAAADAEHLQLPAGERRRELSAAFLQVREVVVDPLEGAAYLGAVPAHVGAEPQVLLHRHAGIGFLALGHLDQPAADDQVRAQAVDGIAVEGNRAAPGLDEPGDRLEQRRLARSVAAQERHHPAAPDLQRHAVQDLDTAVSPFDPVDHEHGVRPGLRLTDQSP
jgi:hypothetical protein